MALLGEGGVLVFDDVLGASATWRVREAALAIDGAGGLAAAGFGPDATLDPETRGDRFTWLDASAPADLMPVLSTFEALRRTLNELAYLGASELELQLSVYEAGPGYERHLDCHRHSDARRLTAVYYANPWMPGDGGELEVWTSTGSRLIEPIADRLVLFRSAMVEHAVRPVRVGPRVAVSGWLRTGRGPP